MASLRGLHRLDRARRDEERSKEIISGWRDKMDGTLHLYRSPLSSLDIPSTTTTSPLPTLHSPSCPPPTSVTRHPLPSPPFSPTTLLAGYGRDVSAYLNFLGFPQSSRTKTRWHHLLLVMLPIISLPCFILHTRYLILQYLQYEKGTMLTVSTIAYFLPGTIMPTHLPTLLQIQRQSAEFPSVTVCNLNPCKISQFHFERPFNPLWIQIAAPLFATLWSFLIWYNCMPAVCN